MRVRVRVGVRVGGVDLRRGAALAQHEVCLVDALQLTQHRLQLAHPG